MPRMSLRVMPFMSLSDSVAPAQAGAQSNRTVLPVWRARRNHAPARERGATLIEVLIALLVFSIGMLGVALMLMQSLRGSRSALLRTQAVNLVSDMADRIRANTAARAAYDLASYGGTPAGQDCASDNVPGSGVDCSAEQLAEDDLARWLLAVRTLLPAPPLGLSAAEVEYFAQQPQRYRVAVRWQEPGEPQPFVYQSQILAAASGA